MTISIGGGQQAGFTTIFGTTAPETQTVNGHTWTANAQNLYQTSSDLATEWWNDYTALQNGTHLNVIQHLEANAEAVFLNTALDKLSAAQQATDRQDAQREFDAMYQAMVNAGLSLNSPLTETQYLTLEQSLQGNTALEELAMQGHGLNNSGSAQYSAGFTNDFQTGVDATTKYIGGGLNNNKNALTDFFDDNILTHVPFGTATINGKLTQLNQNGDAENTVTEAVTALDDSMYYRTYTSADFAAKSSSKNDHYVSQATAMLAGAATQAAQTAAANNEFIGIDGFAAPDVINSTAHVWTADANGLYHTSNLAAEWHSLYVQFVTTGGTGMTAEQRLEANAEAVFENTALSKLSASQQQVDREDAQRQFDAEFAAMTIAGLNPNVPLTQQTYLELQQTLQDNAGLEQLAVEGHGLNKPPSPIYDGYTNDFQNGVDAATFYVGPGHDHNQNALTDFFDDDIMTHLPFATVVKDGKLIQLNQNGAVEVSLATAVAEFNQTVYQDAYYSKDFSDTK